MIYRTKRRQICEVHSLLALITSCQLISTIIVRNVFRILLLKRCRMRSGGTDMCRWREASNRDYSRISRTRRAEYMRKY